MLENYIKDDTSLYFISEKVTAISEELLVVEAENRLLEAEIQALQKGLSIAPWGK